MNEDVKQLMSAFLGDNCSLDQLEILLNRLDADSGFRNQIAQEMYLRGLLQLARSGEPKWPLLEAELSGISDDDQSSKSTFVQIDSTDRTLLAIDHQYQQVIHQRRLRMTIAVAASILMVASCAWLALRQPSPSKDPPNVARTDRPQLGPIAVIINQGNVRWSDSKAALSTGELLGARHLKFDEGQVSLAFVNGVLLTVQGPADFSLTSPFEVAARMGKMRVVVPDGAEGFSIATPKAVVKDLGTEFALNINGSDDVEVRLIQGAADIGIIGEDNRIVHAESLPQGKTVRVSHGSLVEIVAERSAEFIQSELPIPQELPLGDEYRQAIFESGPELYWKMESMENDFILSQSDQPIALKKVGSVQVVLNSRGVGCCVFQPTERPQFLSIEMPELKISRATGFALEFWFMADRYHQATLLGLLEGESDLDHTSLIEISSLVRQGFRNPLGVRALDRYPSGQVGGLNLYSQEIYRPNRWHHVVVQRSREAFCLFLDGYLVSQSASPIEETVFTRLILGRVTDKDPVGVYLRPFMGRIAELAIYSRILSEAEIKHHSACKTTSQLE